MTTEQLSAFDEGIKVGDPVEIFWVWCGLPFTGRGVVTKVNRKSAKAALDHPVRATETSTWDAGFVITVPRMFTEKWSHYNCVKPVVVALVSR